MVASGGTGNANGVAAGGSASGAAEVPVMIHTFG